MIYMGLLCGDTQVESRKGDKTNVQRACHGNRRLQDCHTTRTVAPSTAGEGFSRYTEWSFISGDVQKNRLQLMCICGSVEDTFGDSSQWEEVDSLGWCGKTEIKRTFCYAKLERVLEVNILGGSALKMDS